MSHKFLVLHFGAQCPWQPWVIEQARKAAAQVDGAVESIDVSAKPEVAARHRLFFPFVTVIDDALRIPSPTPAEQLVRIAKKGAPGVPTIVEPPRPETRLSQVVPLTAANIEDTCPLCIPTSRLAGCRAKQAWASGVGARVPGGILGFIAYRARRAMGAVEFLPAPLVPYPLPSKEPSMTFITCIYSQSEGSHVDPNENQDCRGHVLEHLMTHLRSSGLKKVQVVAGRRSAYPNGPIPFFASHGFRELLQLDEVVLREGQEELVLMERDTST